MPWPFHCRGVGRDILMFGTSVVVIRFAILLMAEEGGAAIAAAPMA